MKGGGGGVPRFAGEAEDRSTAAFNRFRSRIFPRCGENGRNEGRNRSGNQATLAYVSRAHDTCSETTRSKLSSKSNNFPFRTHRAGSRDVASFVKKVWKGETKIFRDGKFIFSDIGGNDSRALIDLGDNSINK